MKVRFYKKESVNFAEIEDMEIFMAGTWNEDTYSVENLQSIVENTNKLIEENKHDPPLKLGHSEMQKILKGENLIGEDGFPAIGWIDKLKLVGKKIVASVKDVPKVIADLINKGAYKKVSCEIYIDELILKAVALLGADIPAVKGLEGFLALYNGNPTASVMAFDENKRFKAYELTNKEVEEEVLADGELIVLSNTNLPKAIKEIFTKKNYAKITFDKVENYEEFLSGWQIVIVDDITNYDLDTIYYKSIFPGVDVCIGRLLSSDDKTSKAIVYRFDRYVFTEDKIREWLKSYQVSFKEIKIQGGGTKMTELEKLQKELADRDAQIIKLTADIKSLTDEVGKFKADQEKDAEAKKKLEIDGIVSGAIKDGKILPTSEIAFKEMISAMPNLETITKFVATMSKVVDFKEVSNGTQEKKPGETGNENSRADFNAEVEKYASDKNVSYEVAFDIVKKEKLQKGEKI